MNKKPIALALSGGGALGAAHIGVLSALETTYHAEYLIGTSAGAIVAAAYACGNSPHEISNYLKDKSLLTVAFDFSFKGSGLIRGKKILDLLNKIFKEMNFEDLPKEISLRICATNFDNGNLVILKSGSIAEAVRASLAVPGLFEPFWVNGHPLIDGGLVSNLPLAPAIVEYKGKKIIGVDVCTSMPSTYSNNQSKKVNIKNTMERALRIMFLHQQDFLPADPRVTIIKPNLESYGSVDILQLKKIEQVGFDAAKILLN